MGVVGGVVEAGITPLDGRGGGGKCIARAKGGGRQFQGLPVLEGRETVGCVVDVGV